MSDSATQRLFGRVLSMIGYARVAASRNGAGIRLLQLRFDDTEGRDGTPMMAQFGIASRPPVGADALVLFVAGNRTGGVVVATNDRRYQVDLAEGEVALHTNDGTLIHLRKGGEILLRAAARVVVEAPLLEVTGDVIAGGVSLREHVHSGVDPGSGTSGPPA
ncbi:phage baseplate assembly protein [Pseudoroseomonas cervicalis]|uniref:Phage baseplate assembly protein V n=1 Tax=Pseudoroseomonas cervicalis ATCC 49957 TaxID=525371 RepID=D5RTF1_9PROT|nr:phage baseplate assembly protein [Pseudoroseomonas cervicalis]EFH09382.1 phage baseplate assembly protein V [Pseudoroseomonas cervicalis ATCC 49957]